MCHKRLARTGPRASSGQCQAASTIAEIFEELFVFVETQREPSAVVGIELDRSIVDSQLVGTSRSSLVTDTTLELPPRTQAGRHA